MEPRRETAKRTTAAAPKTGASKKPEGSEASTPPTPNQQTGGTANQQAGQQAGAQNQNQDLLQHAKQATGEIVSQVQERAGSQIERQKETAASELSQIGNAVRQLGQTLSGEAKGPIARYAAEYSDKAANSLDRFSSYIREQDPKRLLNDVQNFGRRQPALLLGGMFLLGFAGARLIKSSMEAASQNSMSTGYQQRYNTQVPRLDTNVSATTPQRPGTNTI